MHPRLLLLLLVSLPLFSYSQTASFVAASQSSQGTTINVDWSIGELITESFSNSTIKVSNGVSESGIVFIITGDIKEAVVLATNVYPVPFQSEIFIEATSGDANISNNTIILLDEAGRKMDTSIDFTSNQKARIDASRLVPGFYILTLRNNTSIKTYKLLKK